MGRETEAGILGFPGKEWWEERRQPTPPTHPPYDVKRVRTMLVHIKHARARKEWPLLGPHWV